MVFIIPCALASAGDIGLSNTSLKYISLSLYTMLKTSSLIFVLVFGLLFRVERFHWRLVVIVVVMTGSVLMMTHEPAASDDMLADYLPIGVVLILAASVILGLRWTFTQLLLKHNDHTRNPILTIFYILPCMTVALFMFAVGVEGWSAFTSSDIWTDKGIFGTLVLMVIPGILAFMMTLCEFQLLSVAPVLTLSIAGIFKELLTIILGTIIFGDTLSLINGLGLAITFLDILWYNYFRYSETDKEPITAAYVSISELSEQATEDDIELKKL